jgi:hypothetical protein
VSLGPLWSPSLVTFTLSLCRLTVALPTLQGTHPPLYPNFPAWLHSQADHRLFWGYAALITHLAACTRPQERGAAVSLPLITVPSAHFWASPITTPPPPSGLAVLNIICLQLSITETDAPTSYPHSPFLGFCPQLLLTPFIPFAYPTQLYLFPLINPPLIPLPHIMGKLPCSNWNITGTHPQGLTGGDI